MARLPQGVRRRKNGALEKRFTIEGIRYSVYGSNTKELAENEQELREQIKANVDMKHRSILLNSYFDEWIKNKKHNIKPNTYREYKSHYENHIRNTLGLKRIKDIKRNEIISLQQKLLNELKPRTVNHIILVLSMVLKDAVIDDIITKSPADNIKTIEIDIKAVDTKHRALTKQEQSDFMNALKGNYYYTYINLMLMTGMRSGEVGALTWQDIDYKKDVIHVNKTITKQENGTHTVGDSTKSKKSNRDIPMNDDIKRIIREQKAKSDLLPFTTCNKNVFVSPFGNIIANQQINKAINDTLDKLSNEGIIIEPFTSHALRDTFATRYIEQGGNMQTLKDILGHNSITLTMDLYAHVLPDNKREEMNRIKISV